MPHCSRHNKIYTLCARVCSDHNAMSVFVDKVNQRNEFCVLAVSRYKLNDLHENEHQRKQKKIKWLHNPCHSHNRTYVFACMVCGLCCSFLNLILRRRRAKTKNFWRYASLVTLLFSFLWLFNFILFCSHASMTVARGSDAWFLCTHFSTTLSFPLDVVRCFVTFSFCLIGPRREGGICCAVLLLLTIQKLIV